MVNEPVTNARRFERVLPETGLTVALRAGGGRKCEVAVRDLCRGGAGLDEAAGVWEGDEVRFELIGRPFRFAGRGRIAHTGDGRTGLQFLSWAGRCDRALGQLLRGARPVS